MEQMMRVVSWTVVLGAVSALIYSGLKPLAKEFGFPPVDPAKASGAMLAPLVDDPPAPSEPPQDEAETAPVTPVLSADESVPPACEPDDESAACDARRTL